MIGQFKTNFTGAQHQQTVGGNIFLGCWCVVDEELDVFIVRRYHEVTELPRNPLNPLCFLVSLSKLSGFVLNLNIAILVVKSYVTRITQP